MIKAIIFDCFGVLVEETLYAFCTEYFPNDQDKIAQVQFLDRQANDGQLSWDKGEDNMIKRLAELAGISREEADKFLHDNPVNEKLFALIRNTLKPKYKIGFLSNAAENWLDDLFTKEQQSLFDDFVVSCEVGVSKPEEQIYEISADHLGVRLDECVFVDDIEKYCDGARSVGMHPIQYKSFDQLKADLSAII